MRFNVRFTRGNLSRPFAGHCKPAINHVRAAFTQNKRYRANPGAIDDVVNRNAVSVYQTDAVLILIDRVQRRCSGASKN
jgi:hypothetical protein